MGLLTAARTLSCLSLANLSDKCSKMSSKDCGASKRSLRTDPNWLAWKVSNVIHKRRVRWSRTLSMSTSRLITILVCTKFQTKSTISDPSVPFQQIKDHISYPTTNTTSLSTSTRGRRAVVETMLSSKSSGKTCPKAVGTHSSLQAQPHLVPWRCSCRSRLQHRQRLIGNKSSCLR